MKLPSGYEISKEKLVELCEGIIGEKFMVESTYAEAFEPTAGSLSVGEFTDLPALDEGDINFLYDALKDVVVGCETALRSTLGTFMESHISLIGLPKPTKPKCPKCGKEIDVLIGSYSAIVSGLASIMNGELNVQLDENIKSWDIVTENSETWHCPDCDEQLFKAGDEDKMTAFLKGEEQ